MLRMRKMRCGAATGVVVAAALFGCSSASNDLPVAPGRDGASGGNSAGAAGSTGGGAGGTGGIAGASGTANPDATAGNAGTGDTGGSDGMPDANNASDGSTTGGGGGNSLDAGSAGSAAGAAAGDAASVRDATADANSNANDSGAGISLFNGIDLTGWEISTAWPPALSGKAPLSATEAEKVFKVESGMIHDYADAADGSDQVRATLTTKASYANYKLTLEYRWGTKKFAPYTANPRDAGILFHVSGDPKKVWPDSTEFQIKENETGDIYALGIKVTGLAKNQGVSFVDVADGGTSKLIDGTGGNARHQHLLGSFELPDWNTVELTVTGDGAVYVVNGKMVNKVLNIQDRTGKKVTSGPIVLQAEHAEVFYRNVRLQVLP